MNNRPVAIVRKYSVSGINNFHVEMLERLKEGTKLYARPAELTDEEIHKVFKDTQDTTQNPNCVFTAFARAILKRAQS